MEKQRLWYTFEYTDGDNTTYAHSPSRVCGTVRAYASKGERDEMTKMTEYRYRGCTVRVGVNKLKSLGYSYIFKDEYERDRLMSGGRK